MQSYVTNCVGSRDWGSLLSVDHHSLGFIISILYFLVEAEVAFEALCFLGQKCI